MLVFRYLGTNHNDNCNKDITHNDSSSNNISLGDATLKTIWVDRSRLITSFNLKKKLNIYSKSIQHESKSINSPHPNNLHGRSERLLRLSLNDLILELVFQKLKGGSRAKKNRLTSTQKLLV